MSFKIIHFTKRLGYRINRLKKATTTYIGGVFDLAINSSFSLMSSLSLGYSSNLSAKPKEEKIVKVNFSSTIINTVEYKSHESSLTLN